ncbi:perlucin-like protein [Asterias amurensis]|uniref:perlucin-like protein n=1 Tax=Asterias amurensis TaxID=7602 RepID=UPI003AB7EE66
MPISVNMYCVFFTFVCTALLDSCCFGVVASRYEQCYTFMYENRSCPEHWHYWGISCYKITEMRFTWADARDECRNLGGVLGVPSSDPEHEFIAQLIPTGGTVWLDCNDIYVEGNWKCREGNVEVAYRNWYFTEPNNKGDEDCAALNNGYGNESQWHDVSCSREERALCKMADRPLLHV